jgi:hypothetical protein
MEISLLYVVIVSFSSFVTEFICLLIPQSFISHSFVLSVIVFFTLVSNLSCYKEKL